MSTDRDCLYGLKKIANYDKLEYSYFIALKS